MSAKGQQIAGGGAGEATVEGSPSGSLGEQYSLAKILGVWAAAALPMAALAWVVAPWIAGRLGGPVPLGRALLALLWGDHAATLAPTSRCTRNEATSPGVVPRVNTRSTPSSPAIVSSNRGPPTTSSGRCSAG